MSKFSTPFLKKSPILGAYTSGAGGMAYASNRQAFQKLQDDIVKGAKEADEIFTDPQTQLERAQKRKAKIDDQGIKIKDGVTDEKGNAIYVDKDGKVINRGKQKLERADKLAKKAQAAQDLLKQRAKNKRSTDKLTAAEKMEITKQHYLSEGGTEDDWNAIPPQGKKEAVLDYRTYYGFN